MITRVQQLPALSWCGHRQNNFKDTICRRLHDIGLLTIRLASCVPLTSALRRTPLTWCRNHTLLVTRINGGPQYSLVSLIEPKYKSKFNFIRKKKRGIRYQPSNFREKYHYGNVGLLIWTVIILEGCTALPVFAKGSITGMRCRDDILEHYVHLFWDAVASCPWFHFNRQRSPERTHVVDEFLESRDIRLIN